MAHSETFQVRAKIVQVGHERYEHDTVFANSDAYAATSFSATKTVHGAYDTPVTLFEFFEPLPDGRKSYACQDKDVMTACAEHVGDTCIVVFNSEGKLVQVDIGDTTIKVHHGKMMWYLAFLGVAIVLTLLFAVLFLR